MLRVVAASARLAVLVVAWGLLSLTASVRCQDRAGTSTVLVGQVLDADGAPASGAVIVTTAGGQAVTDAEGSFRLEIALPAEAASVQVTAVMSSGTGSLVASVQVGAPTPWGTTSVGTLILKAVADCQPGWLPTFGQFPGVSGGGVTPGVSALTVFDDGGGAALYVAGGFLLAGGAPANFVAKWDGALWTTLGGGMNSEVYALTVFDDGSGRALYAGGAFSSAGGVSAYRIAKWDGTSWSALGSGMAPAVYSLCVFDDGSGPALYAGGDFKSAGGVHASNVARWDGSNWSALGEGLNGRVLALAGFDDGDGPALYAGGTFQNSGPDPVLRIAKWGGSTWSAVGGGMNGQVRALAVFDDGGGPALYAGGSFSSAGGVDASRIAKWDGALWSSLGGHGVEQAVDALAVFDDGGGPALYAGGHFTTAGGGAAGAIAKWNGASWSEPGGGVQGEGAHVRAFAVFDSGGGPALCAGGAFSIAGDAIAHNVAQWSASSWSALGSGLDDDVDSLAVFDDGGGPALYVGGSFRTVGGVRVEAIAKWDGTSWSALGSGVSALLPFVTALAVFDDGSGPALFAAGGFTGAGGVPAKNIAKWDGTSWSALSSGTSGILGSNSSVYALAVFDDGGGPALYAGGGFTIAGGVAASRIAKWDGTNWSPLGSGIGATPGMTGLVEALAVHDDGGGPALYAGGGFSSAGGVAASRIAKWDGASWSSLGSGLSGGGFFSGVRALASFDDGGGLALYAGGTFTTAGGVPARGIAKWTGASWSALGSGVIGVTNTPFVAALKVYDDGSGPALFAGGVFSTAGGVAANFIAKWSDSSWSAVGSGMDGSVEALESFDAGGGPALIAGGRFGVTLDSQDSFLARWACPAARSVWTDLGFALSGATGAPSLIGTGLLTPASVGTLVLSNAAPSKPAMLFVSLASAPTPFHCGTLVPVPIALQQSLVTSVSGNVPLSWPSWPGGLSGLSLYFQYAIQDPAALCGVALSNALRADVP